jgi:TonB family protein
MGAERTGKQKLDCMLPNGKRTASPSCSKSTCSSVKAMSDWNNQLVSTLEQNKQYPTEARNKGEQGTVVVNFTVDRDGNLVDSKVSQSSGSVLLDQAAIDLLQRTQPFAPLPSDYDKSQFTLRLPIRFSLPPPTAELNEEAQSRIYGELVKLADQSKSIANDQSLTSLQRTTELQAIKERPNELTIRAIRKLMAGSVL